MHGPYRILTCIYAYVKSTFSKKYEYFKLHANNFIYIYLNVNFFVFHLILNLYLSESHTHKIYDLLIYLQRIQKKMKIMIDFNRVENVFEKKNFFSF